MKQLIFGLMSVLLLAIAPAKAVPTDEITELLNRQQQAWNQATSMPICWATGTIPS